MPWARPYCGATRSKLHTTPKVHRLFSAPDLGILSRLPLLGCAATPMGGDSNGAAARAVVELDGGLRVVRHYYRGFHSGFAARKVPRAFFKFWAHCGIPGFVFHSSFRTLRSGAATGGNSGRLPTTTADTTRYSPHSKYTSTQRLVWSPNRLTTLYVRPRASSTMPRDNLMLLRSILAAMARQAACTRS